MDFGQPNAAIVQKMAHGIISSTETLWYLVD